MENKKLNSVMVLISEKDGKAGVQVNAISVAVNKEDLTEIAIDDIDSDEQLISNLHTLTYGIVTVIRRLEAGDESRLGKIMSSVITAMGELYIDPRAQIVESDV